MKTITRRKALTALGLGSAYLMTGAFRPGITGKKHIITLSYDDGFEGNERTKQAAQVYAVC